MLRVLRLVHGHSVPALHFVVVDTEMTDFAVIKNKDHAQQVVRR